MTQKIHDRSLKFLVADDPTGFILFGLRPRTLLVLRPVETDLPSRDRVVDGSYLVERDGVPQVIHIEFFRMHQGLLDLALDIGEAQVRIHRKERVPVYSLLWDLYGAAKAPVLERRAVSLGVEGDPEATRIVYVRVNLRGMATAELLETAPKSLYPLVPLTRDGANIESVRQAMAAIEGRPDLSPAQRADHLTVLRFLAEAEHVPAKVLEFYLTKEKMMESSLYQSIYSDGEAAGRADGLIRLLVVRLGQVPLEVRQAILTRAKESPELISGWSDEVMLAPDAETALGLVRKITGI